MPNLKSFPGNHNIDLSLRKRSLFHLGMALCLSVLFLHCGGKELVRRTAENSDVVYWSETRMLSWDDFQGTPILDNPDMASAISIYNPSAIERKNLFLKTRLVTECYVDKKSSWVDRKRATDDLLAYNQVIFDIHELYTRKLQQAFMAADFGLDDVVESFNRLVEENGRSLNARLNAFQRESQMGSKADVTQAWFRQIRAEIRELAGYR
jgi:hypothetical protein